MSFLSPLACVVGGPRNAHLCAEETVDILEDAKEQLAAFLPLLFRLFLNLEPLLLSFREQRLDFAQTISERVGIALVSLGTLPDISMVPTQRRQQRNSERSVVSSDIPW